MTDFEKSKIDFDKIMNDRFPDFIKKINNPVYTAADMYNAYISGYESKRKKHCCIPVTGNSKSVRCNHCMSIFYEEYIIKDDNTESGERCPVCGKEVKK